MFEIIYKKKNKENAIYLQHLKTITNEISYGFLDCVNNAERKKMANAIVNDIKTSLKAWAQREKVKYIKTGLRKI